MSSFLKSVVDYKRHNDNVHEIWDAYNARKPIRVPLRITGSITNYIQNPDLNRDQITFQQYFEDVTTQIKAQLEYQHWQRHNILCDMPMGLPEEGWHLFVDFQNSYDASWVGCELKYMESSLPDTVPMLAEHKEMLYDLPEWLPVDGGLIGRGIDFYEAMREYCAKHDFYGKPIQPPVRFLGESTDGVLDLAYKIRGAENILIDMLEDEKYYCDLMDYLTRNLIHRMKKLRERRWLDKPDSNDAGVFRAKNFAFADDAIALISSRCYMDFVFPYHKQIVDAFSDGNGCSMHICGSNMQHFATLAKMLNIKSFDTGFTVDHGLMRKQLGPEIEICGGPTVMLLKGGSTQAIAEEAKRILQSGVMEGGRFIMIAANNLAPQTPVENIEALYEAINTYGMYNQL
jgi:hypothetical protein